MSTGTSAGTGRRGPARAKALLIASAWVNQIGNFLTFTAVIVQAQVQHGSSFSALVLLAQSVPALLAARGTSRRVPAHRTRQTWIAAQVALAALNLAVVPLYGSRWAVLVFVAATMLLRAVANPLFYAVLGEERDEDRRRATLTAVGAAGSFALVISPAAGGAVLAGSGMAVVLALDALTYLLAAALFAAAVGLSVPPASAAPGVAPAAGASGPGRVRVVDVLGAVRLPVPGGLRAHPALLGWVVLIALGAVLNAVQAPASFTLFAFSEADFGVVLAAFGAGGLAVFVLSTFSDRVRVPLVASAALLGAGLVLWALDVSLVASCAGFAVAGFGSAAATGAIRADVAAAAERGAVPAVSLWSWANQVVLAANLVLYGAFAALFAAGVSAVAGLVALVGLAVVLVVVAVAVVRGEARTAPSAMIGAVSGVDRDRPAQQSSSGAGRLGAPRRRPRQRGAAGGALAAVKEAVLVVVVALVVSLVVKTFVLQAFFIPSRSMEQTLDVGDRVVVSKLTPGPFPLHRGDVVVFSDPGGWLPPTVPAERGPVGAAVTAALTFVGLLPEDSGEHLIKRVVGLPGDRVACDGRGPVTVNGTAVDEAEYLAAGVAPSERAFDVTVPAGQLWVMGDNRPNSADSREHPDAPHGGFVPVELVVGRAHAVVWPLGHASWLGTPAAFDAVRS